MTPEQRQLKQDYMDTFSSDYGKRVLLDIENHCFKRDTTIISEIDAINNANEGKRQVLLHIETMMSPEGMAEEGASNTGR